MFIQGPPCVSDSLDLWPERTKQQPQRRKECITAPAATALQVPQLSCFISDGVPGLQMAISDYTFIGELPLLAAVCRTCVAIARATLKARTSWELADYVGLDWAQLCLILPQLRSLQTLHLDASALLPPCASRGRLKLARAVVAQLVWSNASSLQHVVLVENCQASEGDFISELQPAARNLRSLYTETMETTPEFTAFLSSACMLTSLSVPNLLGIHVFCDDRRRHCPRLPQLEHLMVKYVSVPDLQFLGESENPFDVVKGRFPHLKVLEEFALNRCNGNGELQEFAKKRGMTVRRASSSMAWASALVCQLDWRSKMLQGTPPDDLFSKAGLLPAVRDLAEEVAETNDDRIFLRIR